MAILLDMDGVLSDFVGAASIAFNRNPVEVYMNWPMGTYDIAKVLETTTLGLWTRIDACGENFWATLRQYSWAKDLYEGCKKIDDTYFLTSPSTDPACLSGKMKWICAFTESRDFRNFLIGPAKNLCAKPSNILVDDCDYNVDNFREAGGKAILFPQPWNKRGNCIRKEVHILDEIKSLVVKERSPRSPRSTDFKDLQEQREEGTQ